MKHIRFWSAFVFVFFAFAFLESCQREEPTQSPFKDMSLNTIEGKSLSLEQIAGNKATIFLFLQPECPFCKSYVKTFRTIDSLYSEKSIELIGVVAGKNYPVDEIKEYAIMHQLKFSILIDPDFALTKKLGATITPEVFLVDQNGQSLYRGLLDDWAYEIGKVRPQVSHHYLMDACNAFLSGNKISPDSTEAIGCYIQ